MDPTVLTLLISEATAGSEKAMGELIEHSQDRLFRFCIYLTGNAHHAQDLCQDTLVRVLEQLARIQDPEKYFSWLFRIAKNLYLDEVKSAAYRREELELDPTIEPASVSSALSKEEMMQIRQIMDELESDARVAILLVYLEEYSYREAADILDISEEALKSRLFRARQLVQERLKK